MADAYIDPRETVIYGAFSREQLRAVVIGKVARLDGAVRFAIEVQEEADAAMQAELDRQPRVAAVEGDPLGEGRDLVVRFGKHLESLKGTPVPPSVFFGADAPSVFARRRLAKFARAFRGIPAKIHEYREVIRDAGHWREEFEEVGARLEALEGQQRARRVSEAELGPELRAARAAWLAVYTANKTLIQGVLRHAGQVELMPLVFDDLAEHHRAAGVSDEVPVTEPVTPEE